MADDNYSDEDLDLNTDQREEDMDTNMEDIDDDIDRDENIAM